MVNYNMPRYNDPTVAYILTKGNVAGVLDLVFLRGIFNSLRKPNIR